MRAPTTTRRCPCGISAQTIFGARPPTSRCYGPILRSNLLPSENWRLGLAGRYIPKRGNVDDRQVDELQNVDPSVMLGGMVGYDFIVKPNQRAGFEAEVVQDVANGNGYLGTLRFTSAYSPASAWHYGFVAETSYASSDYMDAYFTVDRADANRSGLRQYDADAGIKDFGFTFSAPTTSPGPEPQRPRQLQAARRRRLRQPGHQAGQRQSVVRRPAAELPVLSAARAGRLG